MASSPTGGAKPMPIEGPMRNERYRLQGMTPEERAYRKQWLQDQYLTKNEPKPVAGFYQQRLNPIRRMYRWPLEKLFGTLAPTLGSSTASTARWLTGKFFLVGGIGYLTYYYFKYHTRDWTTRTGWIVRRNKPMILPGDPEYPYVSDKKPFDYASEGFENSPI